MLCLSRKKNERVCIGDDIEVVVVDVNGDKVRLGIVAPKNVTVDRYEVRQEVKKLGSRLSADEKKQRREAKDRLRYEELKTRFEGGE